MTTPAPTPERVTPDVGPLTVVVVNPWHHQAAVQKLDRVVASVNVTTDPTQGTVMSIPPGVCLLSLAEVLVNCATELGKDHNPSSCGVCDTSRPVRLDPEKFPRS